MLAVCRVELSSVRLDERILYNRGRTNKMYVQSSWCLLEIPRLAHMLLSPAFVVVALVLNTFIRQYHHHHLPPRGSYSGWCQNCRSPEKMADIRLPYACKLLFQVTPHTLRIWHFTPVLQYFSVSG